MNIHGDSLSIVLMMAWSKPKTDFVQRIVGTYIREQKDT